MSGEAELSQRVREFLERNIDSVAELEALLLLRASDTAWEIPHVAGRLYTDDRTAAGALAALHRRGLLGREGDRFRYAPASPALRDEVDALAGSYPRFLIRITNVIHSKPRAALREFLDAFRLYGKPTGEGE